MEKPPLVLQDSLDKQDSIAEETGTCKPKPGGVAVYSQDTFGNESNPYEDQIEETNGA